MLSMRLTKRTSGLTVDLLLHIFQDTTTSNIRINHSQNKNTTSGQVQEKSGVHNSFISLANSDVVQQ